MKCIDSSKSGRVSLTLTDMLIRSLFLRRYEKDTNMEPLVWIPAPEKGNLPCFDPRTPFLRLPTTLLKLLTSQGSSQVDSLNPRVQHAEPVVYRQPPHLLRLDA